MKKKLDNYKKILIPIIERYVPDARIILYGSRARGDDQEGSDIDIALAMGSKIDRSIISNIKTDIEESIIPVYVDIVDMHAISDDMKSKIQKDGVLWKN